MRLNVIKICIFCIINDLIKFEDLLVKWNGSIIVLIIKGVLVFCREWRNFWIIWVSFYLKGYRKVLYREVYKRGCRKGFSI